MMSQDRSSAPHAAPDAEELAAQVFAERNLRQDGRTWTAADQIDLDMRLAKDAVFAAAYRRVEQSWVAVGKHATSAELMALREQAISRARRASARRWGSGTRPGLRPLRIAASLAAVAIILAGAYEFAPFGLRPGECGTRIAEQRSIELPDRTRITLDADTRLRVHFSKESRTVQLQRGQAQFIVAKDLTRPFKVEAGDYTVVAVGTAFTVEYIDREMRLAMLEGKVAVLSPHVRGDTDTLPTDVRGTGAAAHAGHEGAPRSSPQKDELFLSKGEALRVARDGQSSVTPRADLQAAIAWREGKVIFHSEPLGQAVRRLNRYSRLQLLVDDRLAAMNISGVFDAGDTAAFVEAVQSYLPAAVEYPDSDTIRLRMND